MRHLIFISFYIIHYSTFHGVRQIEIRGRRRCRLVSYAPKFSGNLSIHRIFFADSQFADGQFVAGFFTADQFTEWSIRDTIRAVQNGREKNIFELVFSIFFSSDYFFINYYQMAPGRNFRVVGRLLN